jgi:DNA-binding PadR family transcriptional regulator
MSLDYAILGFLSYAPLTGYDLKKVFDSSIRHFWFADQSQIYRTLSKLTKDGLAEMEVVEQTERPDRKVYHITSKGREELKSWLAGPIPMENHRSAQLIQVFFAGQLDDEHTIQYFRYATEMIRGILAIYNEIPDILQNRILKEIPGIENLDKREQFFWLLTLESGINNMHSSLEWMESVIERLEKKDYTNRLNLEKI